LPGSFVPKYFGSEWSYAQVRGLEGKCICAFDRDSPKIIVVCADGTFMTLSYEEGGECTRLTYARFVKGEGEIEDAAAAVPVPGSISGTPSLLSPASGEMSQGNEK
jgi:hypothetical protein